MIERLFSSVLVLLSLSLASRAQENLTSDRAQEQERLNYEVTVTANRVETTLKETASSVTVLTREDLEKLNRATVLEALAEVIGFSYTRNGPPGSASSAFIRGANAEHTKVMIDGVELNDPITPGRTFDLGLLLVESIEKIEIARGPQSTLYGSDALGGVIHIISREGRGKPRLQFTTQGGSFRTVTGATEISGKNGALSYTAGASYYDSQGFSAAASNFIGNTEEDGFTNLSLSAKLGLHPRDNLDLTLSVRSIASRLDLDNFGGDFGDDPNSRQDYNALLLSGSARGLFARKRWQSMLTLSFLGYDRHHENPTDEQHPWDADRSRFRSHHLKWAWQNHVTTHPGSTVTAGLEYSHEQGESEYRSESRWGPFESLFPRKNAQNIGIYVQERLLVSGWFFASLGIRYDHHSQAGGALTYRIAPGVAYPRTGTRLKATLGTGFKSPTLYQLFAPASLFGPVGNAGLDPERSLGWEVGIEQEFLSGRIALGALYFTNTFENLIDFDFLQGYLNIGKAASKGAEFFLRFRPQDKLRFTVEHTATRAWDADNGEALLRRPRHKLVLKFNYALSAAAHVGVELLHIGEREDRTWDGLESARVRLDSYSLLNASASYEVLPFLRLFGRLDNMLDQEYEVVKGYGVPGFSVWAGLGLKL